MALLLACCGCPLSLPEPDDGLPRLDGNGNSTFDHATALPLAPADTLDFEGAIDAPADLDLFALGVLNAGDRLLIDVEALTADLDLVAAVFDSRQYLQAYNDDRTPDTSDLDPLIDFVVREVAGAFYLGVAPYAESSATGTYRVHVRITRAVGVPPPRGQVVFLNWAGGQNIVVPNVGTFDLPPFDAADLGPYGGRTAEMKDRVQTIVAQRYAGYNLTLLNSDDDAAPAGPHSTVYFGGNHPQAFAISEQVDSFNADASDTTIIFTEAYRDAFPRPPSFEQMAEAVGNTVAHEVGHLLGLVHTADCNDLMDSTCPNSRILSVQELATAVLDLSVFPVGYQAAREILAWVLGWVGLAP